MKRNERENRGMKTKLELHEPNYTQAHHSSLARAISRVEWGVEKRTPDIGIWLTRFSHCVVAKSRWCGIEEKIRRNDHFTQVTNRRKSAAPIHAETSLNGYTDAVLTSVVQSELTGAKLPFKCFVSAGRNGNEEGDELATRRGG